MTDFLRDELAGAMLGNYNKQGETQRVANSDQLEMPA
jgi:hypothetical protein